MDPLRSLVRQEPEFGAFRCYPLDHTPPRNECPDGSVVADAVCIVQIAPLTLYWDADGTASNNLTGTGAGLGGSGTWAAGSGNCWYDPITGQDIPWVNGAQAVFTGSAGAVTISGAVSASKITVTGGNVALQSGSISLPSSGGTTFEVANGTTTISSSLTGSGGLTTSGGGTLALSGVNTYTGLTTAGGGTLRFSGPASAAVGSIMVSGGDISIDNGVTLVSRTGNIQFSTNNSIKPTGTSGALGFPALNSAYVVSVDSGITGTISAAITGTTTGNAIRQLGPGTLLLAGQNNLVTDTNSNLTAYLALDGGGTVNVTGRVKAASSLQSGRSNGTSTVGQTSGGNTLNISGVGQVIAGRLDVGGASYGGNSVVISSPGSQANPSYWMIGSGAQLNVGVSSSGNSVVVSNGAYLYQSNAGGTNAWTIGANAGAKNNSLTVTGAGSTVDRTAAAGSPIVVGAAGSFNSLAVNDGALLRPRRLIIGSDTAAGNGSNNTATVSGSGSSIVIANDSNGVFQLGSGVGSSGNSLTVSGGASISLVGANASRDFSIGSANLANNNYVRITGAGSSATIANQGAPLAIGGINNTGSIVDSTATGNHLDVHAGGRADGELPVPDGAGLGVQPG